MIEVIERVITVSSDSCICCHKRLFKGNTITDIRINTQVMSLCFECCEELNDLLEEHI